MDRRLTLNFKLIRFDWYLFCSIMDLRIRDLHRACKAGFNPNQPRVPRGNPLGGQWTRTGGGAGTSAGRYGGRYVPVQPLQPVSSRPRGSGTVRIGGRLVAATPAQQARLAVSHARAQAAERQVREIDPNWRPTPSLHETVEGAIAANERVVREAEARLQEFSASSVRPSRELFAPGGQLLGWRERRADGAIRTVSRQNGEELLHDLWSGSVPIKARPNYAGQWYRRQDSLVFGVRISRRHGITIEVIESNDPNIRDNLKIHFK